LLKEDRMSTPTSLANLGLPPVYQVGFVVRDLEAALAKYEPLFGPFTLQDIGVQPAVYRGRPCDYVLKIAYGRSGNLEIELIEWVSGDCPHREFLEQGREGMHHLQFRVDDVDAWIPKVRAIGYEPIWYSRLSPEIAYAYLERADDPLIIEFLELPA
jgi:methylmalonyl-CoA/ethylmalonyl-CoA epimerase